LAGILFGFLGRADYATPKTTVKEEYPFRPLQPLLSNVLQGQTLNLSPVCPIRWLRYEFNMEGMGKLQVKMGIINNHEGRI